MTLEGRKEDSDYPYGYNVAPLRMNRWARCILFYSDVKRSLGMQQIVNGEYVGRLSII